MILVEHMNTDVILEGLEGLRASFLGHVILIFFNQKLRLNEFLFIVEFEASGSTSIIYCNSDYNIMTFHSHKQCGNIQCMACVKRWNLFRGGG